MYLKVELEFEDIVLHMNVREIKIIVFAGCWQRQGFQSCTIDTVLEAFIVIR